MLLADQLRRIPSLKMALIRLLYYKWLQQSILALPKPNNAWYTVEFTKDCIKFHQHRDKDIFIKATTYTGTKTLE